VKGAGAMRGTSRTIAVLTVAILTTAATASEPPAPQAPGSSGQLIVERIEDSWLIALIGGR